MGPRRLRGRLDALQAHTHAVLNSAQGLATTTDQRIGLLVEAVLAALDTVTDVLDEIRDGVSFELDIAGKRIPCALRLNLLEGDDPQPKE